MIIDCIADTHGFFPELPGGDLLIVAGDLTARDTILEYKDFDIWLAQQDYKKKVVVAGNHDNFLQKVRDWNGFEEIKGGIELCDSGTEFEGLKIWGTPWSLTFPGMNPKCKAFTVDTEAELKEKYDLIPDNIDILISHTPFLHMLDQNKDGYHCGSMALRDAVDRVKPRLFVCGHLHEQGGNQMMYKHVGKNTWCVNASHVDEKYKPKNAAIRIEL